MKKSILGVCLSLGLIVEAAIFTIKNNLDKEIDVVVHSVLPIVGDKQEQKRTLKARQAWNKIDTGGYAPTYISWDIYGPTENVRWIARFDDVSSLYTSNGVFNIRKNGQYDVPSKTDIRRADRIQIEPKNLTQGEK